MTQDTITSSLLPAGLRDAPKHITGSTAMFGSGADIDVAVNAGDTSPLEYLAALVDEGWKYDGTYAADVEFLSLRRGNINLLVCSAARYASFEAGLAACRVLVAAGLLLPEYKQSRVNIFEACHAVAV